MEKQGFKRNTSGQNVNSNDELDRDDTQAHANKNNPDTQARGDRTTGTSRQPTSTTMNKPDTDVGNGGNKGSTYGENRERINTMGDERARGDQSKQKSPKPYGGTKEAEDSDTDTDTDTDTERK